MNNIETIIVCNEALIEINKAKLAILAAEAKINAVKQSIVDSDEQVKAVCAPPQLFEAELYLFPQKSEHLHDANAKYLIRQGAKIGIAYEEDEPIVHVYFQDKGETRDNVSWQDHALPKALQEALKLDPDGRHFAPHWIPLHLVKEIAEKGFVDLKPNSQVTIRITEQPGYDLKETLASIGEA